MMKVLAMAALITAGYALTAPVKLEAQSNCPQGTMTWSSCMTKVRPGYQTRPNSPERRTRCEYQKANGCIRG